MPLNGLLIVVYTVHKPMLKKTTTHFTGKFDDPLKFGELRTLAVDEQWYSLGQALGMNT